jgi:hypothetical protein
MAAIFAFLGMLLLSLVVALLAALQLADFFRTGDEFLLVVMALAIFAAVATVAFAIGHWKAKRIQALHWIAFVLAVIALAPMVSPRLVERIVEHSAGVYTVGVENTSITLELVIPALLAVMVQWGLVRRRWLLTNGAEDLTLWPWVTTVTAGLVVLNPIGLAVLSAALSSSGSDFMRQYFAMAAAVVAGILVVAALIECYIRRRILRRRLKEP